MREEKATVESVYGNALYLVSKERTCENEITDDLNEIERVFSENYVFNELLRAHVLSYEEKKDLIKEVFEGKIKKESLNFLYLLIDRKRYSSLRKIIKEFKDFVYEERGARTGVVNTATELPPEKIKELEKRAEKLFGVQVYFEQKIKPEIIAGIKVYVSGKLVDLSIKGELEDLRDKLL